MHDIIKLCDELACGINYTHWKHPLLRQWQGGGGHEWHIVSSRSGESRTGLSESYTDCLKGCKEWLLQIKARRQA